MIRPYLAPAGEPSDARRAPPTFSIVIPAYNAAEFVAGAVESALAQTRPPWEVIVCDDGSSDDLRRAVAPYERRIVLVEKEHGGLASARNAGVAKASADFVAFLDADNAYLPEFLEAVGDLAALRPDLDIITTDAFLELDGNVYGRYYRDKATFAANDQRRGIIHQHFVFGNGAIRRSALVAVGGYDESVVAEDTDLFVRMILGGAAVGLVDEPLCIYRIRPGSLSSSRPRMLRAAVEVAERARAQPSLSNDERAFLERELQGKRIEAVLAEAEESLRGFAPGARRRSLLVAFGPHGLTAGQRARAVGAALAPGLARRYLEALERRTGRSRLARATHGR